MTSRLRFPAGRGAIALAVAALTAAFAAYAAPDAGHAGAAPLTVTVTAGQSLNDIAVAVTQSRDPGVLARTGRALFDANPQAFMKHDPSRLRIGATLTVPPLDATGAVVAHGASGAAGVAPSVGASAPALASHAPGASTPGVSTPGISTPGASTAAGTSAPTPGGASAAVARGASAPDLAVPSVPGSAALASGASIPAGAASGPVPGASAPLAAPAQATGGESGPHVWAGSIQAAPVGASEAGAHANAASPAADTARGGAALNGAEAAQARPSSLQQLLALKNRVLMELQKHGIGKPAPDAAAVAPRDATAPAVKPAAPADMDSASGAAGLPAAAASGVAAASAPAPAPLAAQPVAAPAAPFNTGAAIAVGAAVAALIVGFALRRRKKPEEPVEDDRDQSDSEAARGLAAPPASTAPASTAPASTAPASTAPASTAPASTAPASTAPAALAAADGAALAAADEATHDAPAQPEATEPNGHEIASSLSGRDAAEADAPQPASDVADEPAAVAHVIDGHDVQPAPTLVWDDEPRTVADAPAPVAPAPSAEFPSDAIAALDSLDMPLPPRATSDGEMAFGAFSLNAPHDATNGLAHPLPPNEGRIAPASAADLTAMQDDELPPLDADDEQGSTLPPLSLTPPPAPLGGAQFGVLNLDFDLDLPASPSAVLPALSPETLAKIAHNKLDLASEYVELGDLAGARTLLQEVVEAGHAGTADEARVRLAKLAELS